MADPVKKLSDLLAHPSSRGGFLTALGKVVVIGGAALAGVSSRSALAASCDCSYYYGANCCGENGCPFIEEDVLLSCIGGCQHHACMSNGVIDCYYTVTYGPNCPNQPYRR